MLMKKEFINRGVKIVIFVLVPVIFACCIIGGVVCLIRPKSEPKYYYELKKYFEIRYGIMAEESRQNIWDYEVYGGLGDEQYNISYQDYWGKLSALMNQCSYEESDHFPGDSETVDIKYYKNGDAILRIIYAFDYFDEKMYCMYEDKIYLVSHAEALIDWLSDFIRPMSIAGLYAPYPYFAPKNEYDIMDIDYLRISDGIFRLQSFIPPDSTGRMWPVEIIREGFVNFGSTDLLPADRDTIISHAMAELNYPSKPPKIYYDNVSQSFSVYFYGWGDENVESKFTSHMGAAVVMDLYGNTKMIYGCSKLDNE